jgi:molybdenum cofactor cytidylyltransferase
MSLEILILAAGESKRFGSAKQLALFKGLPLITHTTMTCLATGYSTSVILGARFDAISAHVPKAARVLHCENWQTGMGASLRTGLASLPAGATGALICLGDQPLITTQDLEQLIHNFEAKPHLPVAARYRDGSCGVPAVFPRRLFSALVQMKASEGARALLAGLGSALETVPLPNAEVDVDAPQDLIDAQTPSEENEKSS